MKTVNFKFLLPLTAVFFLNLASVVLGQTDSGSAIEIGDNKAELLGRLADIGAIGIVLYLNIENIGKRLDKTNDKLDELNKDILGLTTEINELKYRTGGLDK